MGESTCRTELEAMKSTSADAVSECTSSENLNRRPLSADSKAERCLSTAPAQRTKPWLDVSVRASHHRASTPSSVFSGGDSSLEEGGKSHRGEKVQKEGEIWSKVLISTSLLNSFTPNQLPCEKFDKTGASHDHIRMASTAEGRIFWRMETATPNDRHLM